MQPLNAFILNTLEYSVRNQIYLFSSTRVAAAFGAPLGGLLFAIEEGASHINHSTLWRIAMSSITSYFTLNIISSVIKGVSGQMSNGGLISFGK